MTSASRETDVGRSGATRAGLQGMSGDLDDSHLGDSHLEDSHVEDSHVEDKHHGDEYDGDESGDEYSAERTPVVATRRRRRAHAATVEYPESDQEWAQRHHRSGRWGRRILLAIGLVIFVVLATAFGALLWGNSHLRGEGGGAVNVTLPNQASHAQLTSALTQAGVVADGWLFRRFLDFKATPPADGGHHVFHRHEGYDAALRDLVVKPQVVPLKLTIPEGYDLAEISAVVAKLPGRSADRFLQAVRSGAVHSHYSPPGSNNLEGLLFPDTYFISPADDEQAIVQKMVSRFDQVAAAVGLDNSAATNHLSPYQTVILASLIEKEAKLDADRPKIARVILNRLDKHMMLQVDATVEYAEGVHKTKLFDKDLTFKSPYNTYLITGLPPGPIGGPGKASLAAALNPTPGTWIYYVLIEASGKHGFATTNQEFTYLQAVAKARGLL